jgi:hypothetical protein
VGEKLTAQQKRLLRHFSVYTSLQILSDSDTFVNKIIWLSEVFVKSLVEKFIPLKKLVLIQVNFA